MRDVEGIGRLFYFKGRIKEIAKRAGETVSLGDLDAIIRQISGLESSAIVAFPNRFVGEEIGLAVVKSNLSDPMEVLRRCREHVSPSRMPRVVVFVETIPRSATGKLKRHLLVPLFASHSSTPFR